MATSGRLAVIITALPLEREAVLEHLRDVKLEPEHRGSIYRSGIFDDQSDRWDIVVAEIGAGNANAAAEAVRVIDCYSPNVAFFVGIAGALKDLQHGDVIASTKVYGYESGKDEADFKPRPAVQLSDYGLEQRARYEVGEHHWRLRIKGKNLSSGAMPRAVVGPIAAGEKVAASNLSQTYKLLRSHYNDAVAVEMEGHGFLLGVRMNHGVQGIVVRGISDCVEGKDEINDTKWQPIAARHAAAFAFQLLSNLPFAESNKSLLREITPPSQSVNLGTVTGDNNSVTIQQFNGASHEELERLLKTSAPDANSEIDAASAKVTSYEPDIALHMLTELKKSGGID